MQIKTFDTILNELCDNFDTLISPKTITRSNTNIIYLLFKAISKGLEVINNVCVILNNKFDPATCEVEDLDSVASLVGTERLQGSASGLEIIITNTNTKEVTLSEGFYNYIFNDDVTFTFELVEPLVIAKESFTYVLATTEQIGKFEVTEQESISITTDRTIPSGVEFSCKDNSKLLGISAETDLEFRQRILEGYNGQDTINELQMKIKNLPYCFDCRIMFNNTLNSEIYDDVSIPPFSCAIWYQGATRSELGEIIAKKIVCPTVETEDSIKIPYKNDAFLQNEYNFYLLPFKKTTFSIEIVINVNEQFVEKYVVEKAIEKVLLQKYSTFEHLDYIKESDVYNLISALNLTGTNILDVNLKQNGKEVGYVEIPISRFPDLTEVEFVEQN